MKLIFLDIDGVLNHAGTYSEGTPWRREDVELLRVPVDPTCMANLNKLVSKTGAKIVISSSWRLFARWQDLGPALVRYGLSGEVIGETPYLANDAAWLEAWRSRDGAPFHYERLERGWEIDEWLRRNPGATSFVILDDGDDANPHRDRLVLTDPIVGLSEPDVDLASRILATEWCQR